MKKKYDLPFGSSGKGTPTKAAEEPKVPTTPSKNRVTKNKTPAKKGTPKSKGKAEVKDETSDEEMTSPTKIETHGKSLLYKPIPYHRIDILTIADF